MNGGIEHTIQYWMDRAVTAEKRLAQATEILQKVYADLEDNFDVVDGSYGQPAPNRWMSVGTNLAFEALKLGINVEDA